ncbi:MAG: hypothetical protein WCD37_03770 [Chloroflexia bacterium]
MLTPRAGAQDIACEPEVAIAAGGEHEAQPSGQTIGADSEPHKPGQFCLSNDPIPLLDMAMPA